MRRKVHLHGPYKAFHDGPIEIEADSIWDAVEAVTSQLKGFQPDPISGRKRIQVAGGMPIERLKEIDNETVDIHILPPLMFGKEGGLLQTIIGAVLIVASVLLPPGPWSPILMKIGIAMVVGGVMQMLSPVPQLGSNNEDQLRSRYLPSGQNTVRIGTTIPLLYGHYRCAGHIMSLNIDAMDTGV